MGARAFHPKRIMKEEEVRKLQELPSHLTTGNFWAGLVERTLWRDTCHELWSTENPMDDSGKVAF
jgi:hypothetical protein